MDAELRQGALAGAPQPDHLLEGVVGAAGDRQQPVPGTQHPEQGGGDRVGAADELQPHGGGLRLEHACEHPIQHLPPLIAMAVAAHRGEVVDPQPLGGEGVQHPLQSRPHRGRAGRRQRGDGGQGGGDATGGAVRQWTGSISGEGAAAPSATW